MRPFFSFGGLALASDADTEKDRQIDAASEFISFHEGDRRERLVCGQIALSLRVLQWSLLAMGKAPEQERILLFDKAI